MSDTPIVRPIPRPPVPPFDLDGATRKVRAAEDAWNTRDPLRVAQAYTPDSRWRNRAEFVRGRDAIVAFLTRKWAREHEYRLVKELWGFGGSRMAVRFAYEWRDDDGAWFRSYGNELWEFDPDGYMRRREASINDAAIGEGAPVSLAAGPPPGRSARVDRPRAVGARGGWAVVRPADSTTRAPPRPPPAAAR